MKNKLRTRLFILFLFFISVISYSQTVEKIKFKKDPALIYFFQKDKKSDTLHSGKENLFYLVASDSIKKNLSLEVENGRLILTANDSLVKLNYLPGFKYESFYVLEENLLDKKAGRKKYEFKTMVDGTSVLQENKISISLINKQTGGLILENVFAYLK